MRYTNRGENRFRRALGYLFTAVGCALPASAVAHAKLRGRLSRLRAPAGKGTAPAAAVPRALLCRADGRLFAAVRLAASAAAVPRAELFVAGAPRAAFKHAPPPAAVANAEKGSALKSKNKNLERV